MTLTQLITEHPEWADLEIVIFCPDGSYTRIGEDAGMVYKNKDENVLVFSPGWLRRLP